MTLAHPERDTTLHGGSIQRVTVMRPMEAQGVWNHQGALSALDLAGWARHESDARVYYIDAHTDRLSLAATVERLIQTRPQAIVLPDLGRDPMRLRHLLAAIAKGLPHSFLIIARESGLQGRPAKDLGHFHFLLTGDTGPALQTLLKQLGSDDQQGREGKLPMEAQATMYPNIAGLTWRDSKGILQQNPAYHSGSELPQGPLPAWDLAPPGPEGLFVMRTSRVCPPDCPTCHGAFGRTLRRKDIEAVLHETRRLVTEYGAKRIAILDTVFDFHPARAKSLLRAWIGMDQEFEISFPNGLRGDRIDGELAHLLRRAGTKSITLPIGSASPRIQRQLGSNLDLSSLEQGIEHLASEGIRVTGLFGFGYEREDPKERERSVTFARRSALHSVRFETQGPKRHGNGWHHRVWASLRFYTGRERHGAWSQWAQDRGETSWQPAVGQWLQGVGSRIGIRQRPS